MMNKDTTIWLIPHLLIVLYSQGAG